MMAEAQTSTDLVIRANQDGRLEGKQLAYIASTDFVPKTYRGNLPAIMACVQTGRELGLGDLEALRSINVIDGRPSLSAELMVKLARGRGHSIVGEYGEGSVTAVGTRGDNGDTMKVTWTMAMAQRAGLVSKDNWKKYPEAMLWARAVSQLCRMLFADVLSGLSYTPDETELTEAERIDETLTPTLPEQAGPDDTPDPEAIEAAEFAVADGLDDEPVEDAVVVEEDGQSTFAEMAEKAQRTGRGGRAAS